MLLEAKPEENAKHGPPDYLDIAGSRNIGSIWGHMDDDEKYHWAKENTIIGHR